MSHQLRLPLPRAGHRVAYGAPMLPPYKFDVVEGCWLWRGAFTVNRAGRRYGICTKDGRKRYVHHVMYEDHVGPIPTTHEIHHVCMHTLCGNPAHLQAIKGTTNRRLANQGRRRR